MSTINIARLKARIVLIGLAGRVLIFGAVYLFKENGYFRHDTYRELRYIMSPLTVFYGVLLLRYLIKMAFKLPNARFWGSAGKINIGYYGLLILSLAELGVITYNALAGGDIRPLFADNFILTILWLEVAFGVLAAFYIAELFTGTQSDTMDAKAVK